MASLKVLRPVRPNVGIQALYRRRMERLVEAMARSVVRRIKAAYRKSPPLMAQDARALPAKSLRRAVNELSKRWQERFDEAAPKLAEYFATAAESRSRKVLHDILREGGFSVKIQLTPAQRDILEATIAENVALIKSIPAQYFTQVESKVMQSVTRGRALHELARDIEDQYGVSSRRAALIARDQNNKVTSALTEARRQELGLYKARWKHSGAGKHPRPSHVAASGKIYDSRKGCYIDGEWIYPGQLINCRCQSQTIIEGF